jgi:hypothetical protein
MPRTNNQKAGSELEEQLALLENSQGLIRTILLGISLQYKSLDLQKRQLLGSIQSPQGGNPPACADPQNIQIAASLIVLSALFGFQEQAEEIACQTTQTGKTSDWTEPKLNATVILVALLRLFRLAAPSSETIEKPSSALLEAKVEEMIE